MGVPALVPRHMLGRKPPHGQPCNRCGACCAVTLCALGQIVFRRALGPCPALVETSLGTSCGLTQVEDGDARAAALLLIGAGDGCDARFNGEPVDHAFHNHLARLDRERASRLRHARRLWEGR